MRLDNLSIPVYSSDDIFELIYQDKIENLNNLEVDPSFDVEQFNKVATETGIPKLKVYKDRNVDINDFDRLLQSEWYMPDTYKQIDLAGFLQEKLMEELDTNRNRVGVFKEWYRVQEELAEFEKRDMSNILRWMIYFVDKCRENNVVWGVGRGSSVASYVLYLIGVHKVNSFQYNLDWREFLR